MPQSFFGAVHERFHTPWKSTILTGMFVSLGAAFLPLRILADLVSIGTLLAFVIVCAAVLIMRRTHPNAERPFRTPFVPVVPILGIAICSLLMFSLPSENWLRLGIWLLLGFIIYFAYSRRHSRLSHRVSEEITDHGITPGSVVLAKAEEINAEATTKKATTKKATTKKATTKK